MNRKYIFSLLGLFVIGLVSAGVYVVNSFTIVSDVYEPLTVKYFIIGDHGNYDGSTLCSDIPSEQYQSISGEIDVQGIYAGESRKFCVEVTNAGEGVVPYVVKSQLNTEADDYNNCSVAFPDTTVTGSVNGLETVYNGAVINVPADAPLVNDCIITISTGRGSD